MPASTGATAAGSVRGRAPAIHWPMGGAGPGEGLAMAGILVRTSFAGVSSLRPVSGTAEEILGLLRAWDAADDPEPLVIATSGSTGAPKRVVLSRDAMRASALATQERLGGPGQWVLNLPPTYVAGVQVLYRSVVAGTEPVVDGLEDRWLGTRTYVSLVPTQLLRLLDEPDGRDVARSRASTRCWSAAARSPRGPRARPRGTASGSCRPTG